MNTDELIERLRRTKRIGQTESGIPVVDDVNPDGREAADRIQSLTADKAVLREALERIAEAYPAATHKEASEHRRTIARTALEQTGEK